MSPALGGLEGMGIEGHTRTGGIEEELLEAFRHDFDYLSDSLDKARKPPTILKLHWISKWYN
jgi:hypothetical protein